MADIIDLVEYRLKMFVDSFYQGSKEWEIAMQVFMLYLDGEIEIRWSDEGIYIKNTNEELGLREVFMPEGGSIY